jgi:hypothetical protein
MWPQEIAEVIQYPGWPKSGFCANNNFHSLPVSFNRHFAHFIVSHDADGIAPPHIP